MTCHHETHRKRRPDAVCHQGRDVVPTTTETKWVDTIAGIKAAGGYFCWNEDATEVTVCLPPPYKISCQFPRKDEAVIDAAPQMAGVLQFYRAICGNTAAVVDRQGAGEAFDMSGQALKAFEAAGGTVGPTMSHLIGLLDEAESFIAGFEDDPMQEGIADLLGKIRAATTKSGG